MLSARPWIRKVDEQQVERSRWYDVAKHEGRIGFDNPGIVSSGSMQSSERTCDRTRRTVNSKHIPIRVNPREVVDETSASDPYFGRERCIAAEKFRRG